MARRDVLDNARLPRGDAVGAARDGAGRPARGIQRRLRQRSALPGPEDRGGRLRRAGVRLRARLPARQRAAQGRVLRARSVRAARHDDHDLGQQSAVDVPGAGDARAVAIRARRDRSRQPVRGRVRDEVFRARRDRIRCRSVRHLLDLRRDRLSAVRRDRLGDRRQPGPEQSRAVVRARVPGRRHRVQVRCRAVPHVAAGRVPGRALARDAVHRVRTQAGRAGIHAAHPRRRARRDLRGLGRDDTGGRGAVAAGRQHRGDRAIEHQAHAGLLDDRTRRLHPARGLLRHGEGLRGSAVLHADLYRRGGRRRSESSCC